MDRGDYSQLNKYQFTTKLTYIQDDHEDPAKRVMFDREGKIAFDNQVSDYAMRPDELEDYDVVKFVQHTYDRYIDKEWHLGEKRDVDDEIKASRCRYREGHHKDKTMVRIIRTPGHNNLPNFIGKFPQGSDEDAHDLYCATMLMLMKPWRDVRGDLKSDSETWVEAFIRFKATATADQLAIISGVDYMNNCKRKSEERHLPVMDVAMDSDIVTKKRDLGQHHDDDFDDDLEMFDQDGRLFDESYYKDLVDAQVDNREKNFANVAVMTARGQSIT